MPETGTCMDTTIDYTALNAAEWDKRAREGNVWTLPIQKEEFERAKTGDWNVLLTPTIPVPKSWFPPFAGTKILGLASGGGQQCPIFVAQGAEVTVFDLSAKQLETELIMAERNDYMVNLVKGDMTKVFPFPDNSFDLVFHPVSNCYIRDVHHVWRESHRVLKPGGMLMAGFTNPCVYLFAPDVEELKVVNKLPYDPILLGEKAVHDALEKDGAIEFSHSLADQIGGQLKAGFVLKDMYEDSDREYDDPDLAVPLSQYMPCYIATCAVKPC